jgi:hypothetical protein
MQTENSNPLCWICNKCIAALFLLSFILPTITIAQNFGNRNMDGNDTLIKKFGFKNITVAEIELAKYSHYGFRTINGYQLNKHYFLGLGVGINSQTYTFFHSHFFKTYYSNYDMKILPIYIDFRYDIRKHWHSFFAYFDLGYSKLLTANPGSHSQSYMSSSNPITYAVSIDQDTYSGGFMYGYGFGYRYFLSPKQSLIVCLSCNIMGIIHNNTLTEYTTGVNGQHYPDIDETEKIGNYLALCIGFTFN